jgi:hypothetical protein
MLGAPRTPAGACARTFPTNHNICGSGFKRKNAEVTFMIR